MGSDEEGTLARLKAHRKEVIDPKIAEHRGRIVKTTGDGVLIEFPSVVDAVRCAVAVQQQMADRNSAEEQGKRIEFRVGINVGDIIIDGDDIYGDGVNIAARLEGLADPGGVSISGRVYEDVRDKLDFAFDDIGEQSLKNIARPVRAYKVVLDGSWTKATPALTLPDKPSISILPFQNLSGDPEQEYFADGIVEEITTALSRIRWLFVIARNSSFSYKGKAVDVKQVARELGVRYVLEGSVRRGGNRVRVTAQLIDAISGAHIWAERYDRDLIDIFAVQDEITAAVTIAIAPAIAGAEQQRAMRKPPESLDAWAAYQRGLWHLSKVTTEDNALAQKLFQQSIDLDPTFSGAYVGLVMAQAQAANFLTRGRVETMRSTEALARRAVALDSANVEARSLLCDTLWWRL